MVQGAKLRPVDDYSVSGVNSTLSAGEAIDPADIDQVTANCRAHADAMVMDTHLRSNDSPFAKLARHPDVEGDSLVIRLWRSTGLRQPSVTSW